MFQTSEGVWGFVWQSVQRMGSCLWITSNAGIVSKTWSFFPTDVHGQHSCRSEPISHVQHLRFGRREKIRGSSAGIATSVREVLVFSKIEHDEQRTARSVT